ncbi:hypothetical protein E24_00472 [Faustovirus]|nr:hypothetical protein PRJ_Fausto_00444 [Faustovirus]AMN83385.1 hypothetical protein E24_00472 [Faustovirus]AMN84369.1 hypothetical protein D5a_00470 [Faustovirus]AMN85355.1 hypothetical protein E23_00472 [Faustovirus]QBR99349.1 hypothetical protein [Faustovirus mariensis]
MFINSIYIKSAIVAAITLIITLAWNDLIQSAISMYLKPGETIAAKLSYAAIITTIGAVVLTLLNNGGTHTTPGPLNQ